ncbi:MAG: DUF2974 domain-containing protein [Clostridia bacterium]|nr:DUF2974 domain-containing protein [Clostridia bacterium]
MANLFDYLAWRGDLSFASSPFCEVDNLVYSMLSVMDYSSVVSPSVVGMPVKLSDCYTRYRERYPNGEYFGQIFPEVTANVLRDAAQSVRFGDSYLTAYRAETDADTVSQFAAVTFVLPDNSIFISFRGTDDTLIGWREDFNLSFMHPVVAQQKAVDYLCEVAAVHRGRIRLGGHSKGGNLAVYAAVHAPEEIRERIITAYSNDGPGFVEEIVASEAFRQMEKKIYTIVPQSSVIGMLLEHKEEYTVVESTMSNGFFQHDPFSWSVLGTKFVHLDGLTKQGKRHDRVMNEWLRSCTPQERKHFTDTLFGVIESTGAKTLSDLSVDTIGKMREAIRAFSELDRESKEHMLLLIRRLAEVGFADKNK